MKIIIPGHLYRVPFLEHDGHLDVRFIRRSSEMVEYPLDFPGINTQELIRVIIDRTEFLYDVGPCDETANAIEHFRMGLYEYEARAYRRKLQKLNRRAQPVADSDRIDAHRDAYRDIPFSSHMIETLPTGRDGHIIWTPR